MALFAQDDVKLRPTLTVNIGIRYDYLTPPENSLSYPAIDIDKPFQSITTVVKEQNDANNFAPRIGFVWSPNRGWFQDGHTVLHGGLAAFYDLDFTNIIDNAAQASPNAPTGLITTADSSNFPRGYGNATGLLATITPDLTPMSAVQSMSNKMVNPITWQYNFGIQRRLPGNIATTINYVGQLGEYLYANQQLNYFVNGQRLAPNRGVINIRSNRGASNYNGLQLEVTRKFQHGLFFEANYTWSKNLDDASEVFSTYAAPTSFSGDLSANNLHSDWGPSVWDRRHVFSLAYSWTPAGFRSENSGVDGVLSALTRHWTIAGTTQLQSGPYSTFNVSGLDTNGDGSTANDRPIIGNPSKPLDTAGFDGLYFGGAPFKPGLYYDGVTGKQVTASDEHWLVPVTNGYSPQEVGRNSYENPGVQYWNISLQKEVPASWLHFDRGSFLFRTDVQNFANHNSLGPLDTNLLDIGTPSYLNRQNAIQGTNRHLQLSAKLRFVALMIDPMQ